MGEDGTVGGVTLGDGPGESPNIGSANFSTSMSASFSSRSEGPGLSMLTILWCFLEAIERIYFYMEFMLKCEF